MTDRRVALLRGINVGRAKRVAMADLRRVFERLGYREVRTLLNSGNVVYTVAGGRSGDDSPRIEKAIAEHCAVTTRVTVLDRTELAVAVSENPLAAVADDPSRLLVLVFRDRAVTARVKPLLAESWKPESLALGKRVGYLWCPEGIVDSRAWAAVHRVVGDAVTARNITTMTKLLALADESGG